MIQTTPHGAENESAGCRRCAACCRQGGPALHDEDVALYRRGVLAAEVLVTYRRGELARENVQGGLVRLESEIVKVRGIDGGFACVFIEPETDLCAIHSDRPSECRALDCRDTSELEAMYQRGRITRFDVFGSASALGELAREHEGRCDLFRLAELAGAYRGQGSRAARQDVLEALRYDQELRGLLSERAGLTPAAMDFIFGRPLESVLPSIGLRAERSGATVVLIPIETGARHA